MSPLTINEKPQAIRLHYKEVLALINLIEEFIRDADNNKPDFSQLNPFELRAYSRLGEMKHAQESYFRSRNLPVPTYDALRTDEKDESK